MLNRIIGKSKVPYSSLIRELVDHGSQGDIERNDM